MSTIDANETEKETNKPVADELVKITHFVYLLQSLSFLFGLTGIAGIILNYLKLDEVKGTWLESHFRWQISTFWIGLALFFLGMILMIVIIGWFILLGDVVFVIYRIVKGWLALYEKKETSGSFL
jgi:uncharacterized membrane protein